MRTRSLVVPLALLISGCGTRLDNTAVRADERAAAIDARIGRMRRDSVSIEGESAEGGLLEADYEGRNVRRLRGTYMGEKRKHMVRRYSYNVKNQPRQAGLAR